MIYFIITSHPCRYPLQAVVSLGQLYGDVLYYATSLFDHYYKHLTYCRPEAYYFWFYFFFMNFIWIVVPGSKYALGLPPGAADNQSTSCGQSDNQRKGIQGVGPNFAVTPGKRRSDQTQGEWSHQACMRRGHRAGARTSHIPIVILETTQG